MKKLLPILTGIFITSVVFSQAPVKMSYQSLIRNNSNQLVTNTSIGMRISILQGSPAGSAVYTETQIPTTNANGLISIEIGGGTVVNGDFSTIDWANGPYFIKTETDPAGGTSYTITGTSQLLSVPYALHAKTAETIDGGITETDPVFGTWDKSTGISITESQISDFGTYVETENDPVYGSSAASGITPTDISTWNNKLDSYTETQTLSDVIANDNSANGQIKNLTDPTDAQDGATKKYVDDIISDRHYIGELFGGGIVFYIYDNGQHGLIASLDDLSQGIQWGGYNQTVNSINDYDGALNTSAIVSILGSNTTYAAGLCDNYSNEGYDDWYLPSLWELNLLHSNSYAINSLLNNDSDENTNGLKFNTGYWSSNEYGYTLAFYINFMEGSTNSITKSLSSIAVRATRKF